MSTKRRLRLFLRSLLMKYRRLFRYRFRRCGPGVYIGPRVVVRPNTCSIGRETFIGPECWLAVDDLTIDSFVMFAGRVSVVGGDHRFDVVGTPSIYAGRDVSKPVIVEDDAWIGHRALIMHGVRIGEGAIVASGALVTKDVEPYSIVAGVPAKLLRMRFPPEDIEKHRAALAERLANSRS